MEHYRILIDTDIGGDVDDALALAMALNTPNVEIVGLSTSSADRRKNLCRRIYANWSQPPN